MIREVEGTGGDKRKLVLNGLQAQQLKTDEQTKDFKAAFALPL